MLEAYGWPHHLSNERISERLLALNLERAGSGKIPVTIPIDSALRKLYSVSCKSYRQLECFEPCETSLMHPLPIALKRNVSA